MGDLFHRLKALRESGPGRSGPGGGGKPPPGDTGRAAPPPAAAGDGQAARAQGPAPAHSPVARALLPEEGGGAHAARLGDQSGTAAGWHSLADQVWHRKLLVELNPDFLRLTGGGGPSDSGGNPDGQAFPADHYFIDTETTGLSGGAGTWAFLVGWSRIIPAPGGVGLEISQYFMEDLGAESAFVGVLDQALAGAGRLVSYNGASFDLPLLRTRWIMNGRFFRELPHEDCLYPARRFWKALLGGASLGQVEKSVMGIWREHDVPGAEVPRLYLEYLRRGAGPDFGTSLGGVFGHHAQDLVSLAALWLLLAAIRRRPLAADWRAVWPGSDGLPLSGGSRPAARPGAPGGMDGTGGLLLPRPARPVPVHARALAACLDAEALPGWSRAAWLAERHPDWGRLAARSAKRAARLAAGTDEARARQGEALAIWRELWAEYRAADALVEALKALEHRGGPAGRQLALALIAEARSGGGALSGALLADLDVRENRLRRRVGGESPA